MKTVVAFQGIEGANSDLAIRQHFGDKVEVFPCRNLEDVFSAIRRNHDVVYGLLPVENVQAGAVTQAYELLMDSDFRIQADVVLHVRHALLAAPGSKVADLKRVRSHPHALAQCDRFLRRNSLVPVPWYDTAGSAKDLAEEPEKGTAAIASGLAGELYGLEVLESNIEDIEFNYTRFFLLGHDDPPMAEYNKTSIVFATRQRPAALYDCLGEFARRDINLTKIESRPRPNRPWEPVFYLDFEGHWQEPHVQEMMAGLLQRASFVKSLGSYPAVRTGMQLVGI
ncbi:MAG: prephenate dehydratase [Anaerolineaceae bacterium]|nr:prephenate dehydratase [Anaerolineaceae bacterium]MDE0329662.1 prephenate dehydratase [Anaerolineaceae bacterium]